MVRFETNNDDLFFEGLFTSKQNVKTTLEQSLMVIQAQRHHNLEIMVPFESRHAGLSNFQVRDGSAAAGPSGQLGFSNEITLKGVSNFKNDNF